MYFDREAESILNKLMSLGIDPFVVGGYVRDQLLGLEPRDLDIALSGDQATLEKIAEQFQVVDASGMEYGVLRIKGMHLPGFSVEISLFRTEGRYLNNRNPSCVCFEASLEEDLQRRDFMINSLAYDVRNNQLKDIWGVLERLKNPVYEIHTCKDPMISFSEDLLRVVRAFGVYQRISESKTARFSRSVAVALSKHAEKLTTLNNQVLGREMKKILRGHDIGMTIKMMNQLKVFSVLFPQGQKTQQLDISFFSGLQGFKENLLIISWLLTTPPGVVFSRWGYAKQDLNQLDQIFDKLRKTKRDSVMIKKILRDLDKVDWVVYAKVLEKVDPKAAKVYDTIIKRHETIKAKELAVTPQELLRQGYPPEQIGRLQKQMLEYVYQDERRNNKAELQAWIDGERSNHGRNKY